MKQFFAIQNDSFNCDHSQGNYTKRDTYRWHVTTEMEIINTLINTVRHDQISINPLKLSSFSHTLSPVYK